MRKSSITAKTRVRPSQYLLLFEGILGTALAILFYKSFQPHQVLFANDGPLGMMVAECRRLPGRFWGTWNNLNWIGSEVPSAAPSLSAILMSVLPPVWFLKIYGPVTLFFVGFSAWVFFRQLKFHPAVCALGGMAAGLNMHFFSTACWGLGSWNISAGMVFLGLAALVTTSIKQWWAKAMLAGLAVGMNVMEGFDVGAIVSIYAGCFVVFLAFSEETGLARKSWRGLLTEVLVVAFAGLIATHTIASLIGTQIEGIAGTTQDVKTKEQRWDFATQWSLPKVETARLVMPGVFGYRMAQIITTPDKSSAYWGLVGQDPHIPELKSEDPKVRARAIAQINGTSPLRPDEQTGMDSPNENTRNTAAAEIIEHNDFLARFSGTGEYAGVLVALLAVFALANSCRGANAPFSPTEQRMVWFWGAAALFSILTAWGRHGFLYSLLYRLPYFSTIRNPIKFLQPFQISWVILAGYGLEVLPRRYLRNKVERRVVLFEQIKLGWWRAVGFEKKWLVACALGVAACLAGWAVLAWSQPRLGAYIARQGFEWPMAAGMAGASVREAAWFIVFLALSAGGLAAVVCGASGGPRSKTVWICLGAIMILDLGRADLPWIHYFDYQEKYSSNDVLDYLSQKKPWEQRIAGELTPARIGSFSGPEFTTLYHFWMQNDFPYHEIQSLDITQMPRIPEADEAYITNFDLADTNSSNPDLRPAARLWELTGTRYLLTDVANVPLLNQSADPVHHGFVPVFSFRIAQKDSEHPPEDAGDLTVYDDPQGQTALVEYTNVLPRAKLFAHWQTPADGAATLATLASPNFIPEQTVLLWPSNTVTRPTGDAAADAGAVEITDYHPKDIKLHAEAKLPSVLLLNERYHPNWSVTVDQQPADLLRCNYIMRGVYLTPGAHTVEFRYRPKLATLFVSLLGWATGLLLAGYLYWNRTKTIKDSAPASQNKAQQSAPKSRRITSVKAAIKPS